MHEVRGVVARSKGAPVGVETVLVPDPGPGEVLVRVQACGVCHTDLHYREGAINDEFPFLLGHEAAGIVEAVGEGVTYVKPGDHVITCLSVFCGTCPQCVTGHPNLCENTEVKMPDVYPTNICFGGRDMKTAYVTLSGTGELAAMDWPEPGLRLNFQE